MWKFAFRRIVMIFNTFNLISKSLQYIYVHNIVDNNNCSYAIIMISICDSCLESESIRHTTELVEITTTDDAPTNVPVIQHVVPMVTYWREVVEYPHFLRRLYDMHITKGHNGILEVRATGIPKPEVIWYKDWHPLVSNSKYTVCSLKYSIISNI